MHNDARQPEERGQAARSWMEAHRRELVRLRDAARARENAWSVGRLLLFAAAASVWYPLREMPWAAICAPVALLIVFGWAVRSHGIARRRRQLADRQVLIAEESLRRCGGTIVLVRLRERPAGPGSAAAAVPRILDAGPTDHLTEQERDDLDLYAPPVGVFGLLNRTSSIAGARRLRAWLEHPCLGMDAIVRRQQCARWLTEHATERVRLLAAAANLREQDGELDGYVQAVRAAQPLPQPGLRLVLQIWTLPSIVLTAGLLWQAMIGDFKSSSLLVVLLGINGLLLLQVRKSLLAAIAPWRKLRPLLEALCETVRQGADDLPRETGLADLRGRFAAVADRAVLPALARRMAWTDSGGFMHALCNLVFFYDLHVAHAVLGRVLPNRERLIDAVAALADLEALLSLGCFATEQPVAAWPVQSNGHALQIRQGAHPLIDPAESIANDVELSPKERTWIITGSNMAGKSTYLRMVGVNVLLAQVGSAACAESMQFVPHRLITDLRIRDDLSKHESYFLAEVRQLRRMVSPAGDGVPLLGLIDEPFRGTNSRDRIAAGRAVLVKLVESPHFFLVATHEEQFTALGAGNGAVNKHFHEDLAEHGPVFDYRLQPGPATKRNALRILEIEGYPADVIARAREWSEGASTTDDA